jgi:hypothetical protein
MSSGVDAVSRVVKLYAATGKAILRGLPREATCPSKSSNAGRSWKPFTRMAKWEIRFQRFAISFRPSALDVCGFRFPLAFAFGANEIFHFSPNSQHVK